MNRQTMNESTVQSIGLLVTRDAIGPPSCHRPNNSNSREITLTVKAGKHYVYVRAVRTAIVRTGLNRTNRRMTMTDD